MNNKFTVEEINLICIFESRSRTKVIQDISEVMNYLVDDEMIELSSKVIIKLKNMSDEDFSELKFVAVE
ncbi:transposon-transfer assisting family protein [Waltera intestinalis]|uniref:Tranposon-transfer assisting protein n=1 Tax=Waltera intestinalis TaxID=2606635 RepID=A0A6L5YLJ1_9FIRM|nr:transposon-transfer assisting family protein [Waltera intestinalis]MST59195.1 hypothetical protein [Waltera intestinalis]